jgi:hypothetical protein
MVIVLFFNGLVVMNVGRCFVLLLGFVWIGLPLGAQDRLRVNEVFELFGKREGAVLVELGEDVLAGHVRISRYKSLIAGGDSLLLRATLGALEADVRGGEKLFESWKGGALEAASYCLKMEQWASEYEYLLFSHRRGKVTLLYVRGSFPPLGLRGELNKLRDLLIEVNN